MPRIRTIKPDFWDDKKVASLDMPARLLFIGMWNFADDYGTIEADPSWIKTRIFPRDEKLRTSDVQSWLDALVKARMIEPFQYNDEAFYNIRTFKSHQRIDKPSKPSIPLEDKRRVLGESSTTAPVVLDDGSGLYSKGKEGKDSIVREGTHARGIVGEYSKSTLPEMMQTLIGDDLWVESMERNHKGKDLHQAIREAYDYMNTLPARRDTADLNDWKRLVQSFLSKMKVIPGQEKKATNTGVVVGKTRRVYAS
jgi:hypothetical protein